MRKVNLNMKESKVYEEIKRLVDRGVTVNAKKAAAVKLSYTLRHINRLVKKYLKEGKNVFSHKNKERFPSRRYDDETKRKITDMYVNEYSDTNITHFSEIVFEELHIKISAETIRLWLLEKKIVSPKSHKVTRKRIKKLLKEEEKKAKTNKESNTLKEKIEELEKKDCHPRRPRCKYMGEMIQLDASQHYWINGQKWYLHLAIDDASGCVVGAYLDYEETLYGYYQVLKQILINYGIPAMFYTDRRTVFEYKRKNRLFDDEDTFTQFSYTCKKLGIEIKTTSVPEAKGRVERFNQTFQSRLPVELRRAGVVNIEDANIFLISYIRKYNDQFALQLNNTKSVFVSQPKLKITEINNVLSVRSVRTIDRGHTIHFKNKVYTPARKSGCRVFLQEGMKVIMIETLDGRLMINVFNDLYYALEVKTHEDISKEFDYDLSDSIKEYSWNLPRKKNWRDDDFLGFLAKQKHRQDRQS